MKIFKIIISFCLISLFLFTFVSYLIPSPQLNKANYIEIYDKDNNLIYSELYKNEADYRNLESLNNYTFNAFVAIEDKNFYKHNGFDITRNVLKL